MDIQWVIDTKDIKRVKAFIDSYQNDEMVKNRRSLNLSDNKKPISRARFWQVLISCLLTTQQRSGPDSPIQNIICANPFPFGYPLCASQADLEGFIVNEIAAYRGIRFGPTIARQGKANFDYLKDDGWRITEGVLNGLRENQTLFEEREAANFICTNFKGFGPKQSRNLLQWLGYTKYEIPLDSRVTKWLNKFGFPVKLSAGALQDENYYVFVLEGVQKLCAAAQVYPCIFDAAVFASFDRKGE